MDEPRPAPQALAHARAHIVAAGSARIELRTDYDFAMPETPAMPQRRRRLARPVVNVLKWTAKRLFKTVLPNVDLGHQRAAGFLDLFGRRYMLDYGAYALLYADGQERGGRSGRALSTLPPTPAAIPTPLWLLDALAGVVSASEVGTEQVRGTVCRHVAAVTDLSRASQGAPGGVAVPARARFEDLLSLALEVWFDGTHLRRIRFVGEHRAQTLELWDFGTPVDGLDWSRLPDFWPEDGQIHPLLTEAAVLEWRR